jgi:hypothetical protein
MREDIEPVQRASQQAVVAIPVHMDASNAGQIREELLSVNNGGATALIADMTATPRVITLTRMPWYARSSAPSSAAPSCGWWSPPSTFHVRSASAAWTVWSPSTHPWKRSRPPARRRRCSP